MAEIANLYCFSSQAHFSAAFRRTFGYTSIAAQSIKMNTRDVGGVFDVWQKLIDGLPDGADKTA